MNKRALLLLAPLSLAACLDDPSDVSSSDQTIASYPSDQGTVDYSRSPTGTYLKVLGGVKTLPVTVYLVFYGPSWQNDIHGQGQLFWDFATGLSGSPLAATLASYDNGATQAIPSNFTVSSNYYADFNKSVGNTLNSTTIAQLLDNATASDLPRDSNAIYLVIPDKTVGATYNGTPLCQSTCGFHPRDVGSSYTLHAAFAINPGFCQALSPPSSSCDFKGGSISPNGAPNHEAMVNTYWHEIAETLTDPDGNGYWLDTDTGLSTAKTKETADQCEGSFVHDSVSRGAVGSVQVDLDYTTDNGGTANTHLNGKDWLLQPMWQNADTGGCVRRLALNHPAAVATAGAPNTATGDLDNNNVGDLLWRDTTTGTLRATTFDASNNVIFNIEIPSSYMPLSTQVYGLADLDHAHGTADLLWMDLIDRNLWVWTFNGLQLQTNSYLAAVPSDELVKAVGDFDGNHRADILFQRVSDGTLRLWRNNSLAPFDVASQPTTSLAPPQTQNSEVVGTGDFDGDGDVEVLWHNLDADTYFTYAFSGSAFTTITRTSVSIPVDRVLGIVDVDRDGTADIVAGNNGNVVWLRMQHGVPGAPVIIAGMPDPEWRYSGGSRIGGGGAGLYWYNRRSGMISIWPLDATGHKGTSIRPIASSPMNYQVVAN